MASTDRPAVQTYIPASLLNVNPLHRLTSRFKSYKSLIAYAGIDPMIRQSGDNDGLHLKISKKGNKRLRTILYLMIDSMRKSNRMPNAIQDYYKKRHSRLIH